MTTYLWERKTKVRQCDALVILGINICFLRALPHYRDISDWSIDFNVVNLRRQEKAGIVQPHAATLP